MTTKAKVILYIDDEFYNLLVFEETFNTEYHIITADSGAEGLEKLQLHPEISVVISDMKMPRMNGLEFVALAKELYPDKSYFLLSGYSLTDEIKQAIDNNLIISYFEKPFKVEEITAAINNIE